MTEKPLLAIDTAGARCSAVVLLPDGTVVARREPEIGRGHAERLPGIVEEVLTEAGLAFTDLGRIAVTVGPGSFTGLRVGIAAARGYALTLDVPVAGVSTLEALAEPHWEAGAVLAILDAKRGEAYLALYDRGGREMLAPAALRLEDLADRLASFGPVPFVTGSGGGLVAELPGFEDARFLDPEGHVDIAAVARLGRRRAVDGPPSPLYLRGADAKPQSKVAALRA